MKRADWLFVILVFCSPILVNTILGLKLGISINGSIDAWVGFYGGFVSSAIPMFILYRTRKWQIEDNSELQKSQRNILQYQAQRMWFEGLRRQLDENYQILDFQGTIIAANKIVRDNCQEAMEQLMTLIRNIEMQSYRFDIYFNKFDLKEKENEYSNCYNDLLKKYGTYVNDLIFICGLKMNADSEDKIKDYITYTVLHLQNMQTNTNIIVEQSNFILKLKRMIDSGCQQQALEDACKSRILDVSFIHMGKQKLIQVTNELLNFEEKSIEDILLS